MEGFKPNKAQMKSHFFKDFCQKEKKWQVKIKGNQSNIAY